MKPQKETTYSILIKYSQTEFEEIASFMNYEKAIDRLQTMLVFFKIPHALHYTPKENKEYLFYDQHIGVGLALKINTK